MIRFARIGRKKQPLYKIVVSEKTKDMYGDYLELLGTYNPRTKKSELNLDRIKYWLGQGAKASAVVHNLLIVEKVVTDSQKAKSVNISKKRKEKMSKSKKEEVTVEKPAEVKVNEEIKEEAPKAEVKKEE